ncbi:mutS domain protein [Cardiosporidium cionae]|uniref:MutS domain protein n=1 Tax=Cardiosporidium cionae TaxID=476202 RepID=A0ABQ7JA55_9APIC|nr:mutS domain protein [Cardiosporidium cionae]|eukprot:KAF8820849.1 mutS domain protein [Cardiosporidium cionae]
MQGIPLTQLLQRNAYCIIRTLDQCPSGFRGLSNLSRRQCISKSSSHSDLPCIIKFVFPSLSFHALRSISARRPLSNFFASCSQAQFPTKSALTQLETRNSSKFVLHNEKHSNKSSIFAEKPHSLQAPAEPTAISLETPLSQWLGFLNRVSRPAAKALLPQLVTTNPLMFDAKGTSLLSFVLAEKKLHPEKVLLIRVGEFYETYGVDAVMMVEHVGLNPMGGKPRAGCPKSSIQSTLDALTANGLSCCVYEELANLDVARGPTSRKLKRRVMAQIVSPENRIYMQEGLCLSEDDLPYTISQPIMSFYYSSVDGYSVAEIFVDERRMYVYDFLTAEAVRVKLESGNTLSVYIHRSKGERAADLVKFYAPIVQKYFLRDFSSSRKFHSAALQQISGKLNISTEDFRIINNNANFHRPQPLYLSTAIQLGLLNSQWSGGSSSSGARKGLHEYTLLADSPVASVRYMHRLLLNPPPYEVATHIQLLNCALSKSSLPIPDTRPIPTGKLVSLITYRTANKNLFAEIAAVIKSVQYCLEHYPDKILNPLLSVLQFETQTSITNNSLQKATAALELIENVIPHSCSDFHSTGSAIDCLDEFFQRSEVFRNRVRIETVQEDYLSIQEAALELFKGILVDYGGFEQSLNETGSTIRNLSNMALQHSEKQFRALRRELAIDSLNNGIFLKRIPKSLGSSVSSQFERPEDRNGRIIGKYWTTKRIVTLTKTYLLKCDKLSRKISSILQDLSAKLHPYLQKLVESSSFLVILQAFANHAAFAVASGWSLPTLTDDLTLHLEQLVPYNLPADAVGTTFTLSGLFLLTGQNMAGKSFLSRSTLALAVLANSGLFCPCAPNSVVPRYDAFVSACAIAHDVPEHNRSLYGQELEQLRILLKDTTNRSFITIDEPCKGTSPRCGAALVGALLEELDNRKMSGFVSTHLHEEISTLPLKTTSTTFKRMGSTAVNGSVKWTYQLEEGLCNDSLGLITAECIGLPSPMVKRAAELEVIIKNNSNRYSNNQNFLAYKEEERGQLSVLSQPEENVAPSVKSLSTSGFIRKIHDLLIEVCDCDAKDVILLPENFLAPPSWSTHSCVYILVRRKDPITSVEKVTQGQSDNSIMNENAWDGKINIYVGETDCIIDRLRCHRSQDRWRDAFALVLRVNNKSLARYWETKLILALKKRGVNILSLHDGNHRNFGVQITGKA